MYVSCALKESVEKYLMIDIRYLMNKKSHVNISIGKQILMYKTQTSKKPSKYGNMSNVVNKRSCDQTVN